MPLSTRSGPERCRPDAGRGVLKAAPAPASRPGSLRLRPHADGILPDFWRTLRGSHRSPGPFVPERRRDAARHALPALLVLLIFHASSATPLACASASVRCPLTVATCALP